MAVTNDNNAQGRGPNFSEDGVTDLWEKADRANKRRERWKLVRERLKLACAVVWSLWVLWFLAGIAQVVVIGSDGAFIFMFLVMLVTTPIAIICFFIASPKPIPGWGGYRRVW